MAQRWEYTQAFFTIHNTTSGRQFCWKNGAQLYALVDALGIFGDQGWELVSMESESFEHAERDADAAGRRLCEYPYKTTCATKKRAVFKRPL